MQKEKRVQAEEAFAVEARGREIKRGTILPREVEESRRSVLVQR